MYGTCSQNPTGCKVPVDNVEIPLRGVDEILDDFFPEAGGRGPATRTVLCIARSRQPSLSRDGIRLWRGPSGAVSPGLRPADFEAMNVLWNAKRFGFS